MYKVAINWEYCHFMGCKLQYGSEKFSFGNFSRVFGSRYFILYKFDGVHTSGIPSPFTAASFKLI